MERQQAVNTRSEPTGEAGSLVPLLASMSKSTRALLGLKLAEADIVIGQDQLLFSLARHKERHLTEVADELLVRPSTVSKMLDPLERAGLCRRVRSEADMRKIVLVLTPDGETLAERAQAIVRDIDRELAREVSERRRSDLDKALATAVEALTTRLARLR